MDLKNLFSERLKNARQNKGLTQEKLSKITGINQKVISKYEQGVILPGADNLQKLIISLEITADYLLLPQATMSEVPRIKYPELYDRYLVIETLGDKERDTVLYLLNLIIAGQKFKELAGSLEGKR
ncbi:MAG: helix-turn-helix domain-containing protein [Candidatus Aminicenantes bacterium]|nr:helix-turn-helix domain-containing protein [Candidatus Aminicenantes bacterium]NIQ65519.1 helix-turn-helix domain-containing protein [Candidatus Aminicenantes bacterium]NIT21519.1 helix-turn-helix domain-containing protein [Candidatus Aminicenantes bacterium]